MSSSGRHHTTRNQGLESGVSLRFTPEHAVDPAAVDLLVVVDRRVRSDAESAKKSGQVH